MEPMCVVRLLTIIFIHWGATAYRDIFYVINDIILLLRILSQQLSLVLQRTELQKEYYCMAWYAE